MKDKMRRFMVPEQQKGSDRVEGPNRSSEVWQQVSYVPLQSLRGETGREREQSQLSKQTFDGARGALT
jgi:hypothetical protein